MADICVASLKMRENPQQCQCEIGYKRKEVSDLSGTNLFEEMKNKVYFSHHLWISAKGARAKKKKKNPTHFHRVRRASAVYVRFSHSRRTLMHRSTLICLWHTSVQLASLADYILLLQFDNDAWHFGACASLSPHSSCCC